MDNRHSAKMQRTVPSPNATNWQGEVRVMVCVGYNPLSQRLINTAVRLAAGLGGQLLALHIETEESEAPGYLSLLEQNLELAERLGACVVRAHGSDLVQTLVDAAQANGVTHLVMGESARSRLEEVMHGSLVRQVLRASRGIDIYIVADPA
jgi:two-component system, OmpR family, sensor histidine kinase KdpD